MSTLATLSPPHGVRRALWHLVCLGLLIALLYPLGWLIGMSFKPEEEIVSSLSLVPKRFILDNYAEVFEGTSSRARWLPTPSPSCGSGCVDRCSPS